MSLADAPLRRVTDLIPSPRLGWWAVRQRKRTAHPRSTVEAPRGAALVIGNYRPAVATARELHRLGYRVVLVSEPGMTGAEHSRYVNSHWRLLGGLPLADAIRLNLPRILDEEADVRIVLPITEPTLNAVAALAPSLKHRVRLAMPSSEVIGICHDKFRWLAFAASAGVTCPPFAAVKGLAELEREVARIGLPVVVRPVEGGKRIGKRKAVTLEEPEDVRLAFPGWPTELSGLLIQRRFEGERYNVYFAAAHGRIVRELHSLSLRTDRADGSGQTIEGTTIEPIEAMSREVALVAQRLNYHGVGCAQFLRDEATGALCFLEINPRFGASYAFVEKAGMELTRLAVELADPSSDLGWAEGWKPKRPVRFVWTYGDLAGLSFSLAAGDIGWAAAGCWAMSAVHALFTADVQVAWSLSDPLPTLSQYWNALAHPSGFKG